MKKILYLFLLNAATLIAMEESKNLYAQGLIQFYNAAVKQNKTVYDVKKVEGGILLKAPTPKGYPYWNYVIPEEKITKQLMRDTLDYFTDEQGNKIPHTILLYTTEKKNNNIPEDLYDCFGQFLEMSLPVAWHDKQEDKRISLLGRLRKKINSKNG